MEWSRIFLETYRGEDHKQAKLTNQQVRAIRRMRKEGRKVLEIAKIFQVTVGHVYNILSGRARLND